MEVLSPGERTPDVSILLPTWRDERFVAEAARALLAQRGVVAEIVASDDASPDRTFEVLREVLAGYRGPHRVLLGRNRRNLGIDHIPHLVAVASCDVMVAAHGDDVSEPARAARLLRELSDGGAAVASSNMTNVDEAGRSLGLQNPLGGARTIPASDIATHGWMHTMFGATLAWRREVYAFRRLDSAELPIGHDHVVPFRGAILGGFRYVAEPLVRYRRHAGQWKNRMHDGGSAAARREAILSGAASSRLCMLRDVRHLLREVASSAGASARSAAHALPPRDLRQLEALLERSMLELTSEWVAARDDLYRDGWRSGWLPRERFERDLAQALADPRRVARLLRVARRLALRGYGIACDVARGRVPRKPAY